MKRYVLDAETYWDDDYSLSKLSLEAYIRDRRFHAHGWGIIEVGGRFRKWLPHEQFCGWIRGVDWANTTIIGHNLHFDGAILAWHYGIVPRVYMDTLCMSRALYPCERSHSLAFMARLLGLEKQKDTTALSAVKGIRELPALSLRNLGLYCLDDCDMELELYEKLHPTMPALELKLIDMTIRMFTQPKLLLNVPKLSEFLESHRAHMSSLIEKAETDRETLNSNKKFAEALENLGVTPPTKISKTTKRRTFAFAKTDKELTALLEHEDPRVQALVAARLGTKSTIIESRAVRFIEMGRQGPVPIQLNYWGAKTTGRDSGTGGVNFQNLPRRGPGKELRNALHAPKGYKMVVGDSSNIELRFAMRLAKQEDVLEKIRRKVDLYCDFATDVYGRVITKADADERFVGKVAMLSLQYGVGAERLREALRQGGVMIDEPTADRIVGLYRTKYPQLPRLWWYLGDDFLKSICNGQVLEPFDADGILMSTTEGFCIPGHLGVVYKNLRFDSTANEFQYDSGTGPVKLYGAKVLENGTQHVSRHAVMYQAALFSTKYQVLMRVHDEFGACVPDRQAEQCAEFMLKCLRTPPPWCKDIPLDGEVHIADSYGEAK